MCDPLSTTASILAVFGFAGQSCQFLFEFFQTFSEVPKEVQNHVSLLHSLRATFTRIETLGGHVKFTDELQSQIKECMVDFQGVELKVRQVIVQMEKGRMRRTWTRLKWTSSAENWLSKFLTRVQIYHTIFSLELLVLHM